MCCFVRPSTGGREEREQERSGEAAATVGDGSAIRISDAVGDAAYGSVFVGVLISKSGIDFRKHRKGACDFLRAKCARHDPADVM